MSEPRTRIDDAIDRAVREIVLHDPPAGFRRRVLSRLERASAPSVPARRTYLWPGLATAAAVIAIVAIGYVVVRDVPQGPVTTAPSVATAVPATPPAPPEAGEPQPRIEPRANAPRTRRSPRQEPVRTAVFGPRDGRISAASLRGPLPVAEAPDQAAPGEPAVPALPPIGVTVVSPLQPLQIAPIVVAPILIPRVQLAPISPPR